MGYSFKIINKNLKKKKIVQKMRKRMEVLMHISVGTGKTLRKTETTQELLTHLQTTYFKHFSTTK